MSRLRYAQRLVCLCLCYATVAAAAAPPADAPPADAPPAGVSRWFDPDRAPFIPVPEIDVDPVTGTTLGIIPTWLETDARQDIRRIYAPDLIRSQYFGYGARGRIFAYPSADTQWSVVGGAKEHVESEFDAQYQAGRLRADPWSLSAQAVYDRSGTPRFYGIGDRSRSFNRTVYTDQQEYLSVQLGRNITHRWQLAYSVTPRKVKILPGTLANFVPLTRRFPALLGIGVTHELLNRGLLSYDSRDDPTIPTHGTAIVLYGGLASRTGALNDSLFSEAGADWRQFWTPAPELTWAAHAALRYLPSAHRAPFWALSSIGGDESVIGGDQPLRGYGEARFYDRNSFSASLELRRRIASFDAVSTHIELQLTPFVDSGSVFSRPSSSPLRGLHTVVGLGLRAVARPFVVGYLDVGVGDEGAAVFTGINYPF